MCRAWGKSVEEVHTGFWWRNLKGKDHARDIVIDAWILLK
jgi:hypothetical protein